MKIRSRRSIFLVTAAITLVLVLIVGVVVWIASVVNESHSKRDQRIDFQRDLIVMQFDPMPYAQWDTEDGVMTLKATVEIAGCNVELMRKKDEQRIAGTVDDYQIEAYSVDEVIHVGTEIKIDDFNEDMASPDEIHAYLRNIGESRFPCLEAA